MFIPTVLIIVAFCYRSNLVELPTSYIANNDNCQLSTNPSVYQDEIDCLKSFKSCDYCPAANNTFDAKATLENVKAMEPRSKLFENGKSSGKLCTAPLDPSMLNYFKSNGYHAQKPRILNDNHEFYLGSRANPSNCRECCQLVSFKGHDTDRKIPLCYNTDTYFNRSIDKDRYCKEVDILREKLKILQNNSYTSQTGRELTVVNLDLAKGNVLRESCITTTVDVTRPVIVQKSPLSSETPKVTKSKVSLKTKKFCAGSRTKRPKGRVGFAVVNQSMR